MSDIPESKRRNSIYSGSYVDNDAISILRSAIRSADKSSSSVWFETNISSSRASNLEYDEWGAVIQNEQILIDRKVNTVRKVYLTNSKYRVGWVVDCDLNLCMVCFNYFNFLRRKHHCRSCGSLVCAKCSPYMTTVPNIDEEGGSRVCVNCFGLKTEVPSPRQFNSPQNSLAPSIGSESHESPLTLNGTVRRRNITSVHGKAQVTLPIDALMRNDFELYEKLQEPKYEEAYRMMRLLIPVDIYKSNLNKLIQQGLPPPVAERIWKNKILWLIVMHPDDISKIHLADFRGKYSTAGLDIIELRAVWFNLPIWNADGNSSNALEIGKAEWKSGLKARLDDYNYKESRGTLPLRLLRNEAYEEFEDLALFDPTAPLKTRFDRSASYTSDAIDSPVPVMPKNTSKLEALYSGVATEANDLSFEEDFGDEVQCIVDGAGSFEFDNVRNNFENFKTYEKDEQYATLLEEINAEIETDNYEISDLEFDQLVSDSTDIEKTLPSVENPATVPLFQTPSTSSRSLNAASLSPIVNQNVRTRHAEQTGTPYVPKSFDNFADPDSPDDEIESINGSNRRSRQPFQQQSTVQPPASVDSVQINGSGRSEDRNSGQRTPTASGKASEPKSMRTEYTTAKSANKPIRYEDLNGNSNTILAGPSINGTHRKSTPSLSSTSSGSDNSLQHSNSSHLNSTLLAKNAGHSHSKSFGSECNDSFSIDADIQTLTTGESSQRNGISYSPGQSTHRTQNSKHNQLKQALVSPSDCSVSSLDTFQKHEKGTFDGTDSSTNSAIKTNSTPFSTALTSVSSGQDQPEFMRSVESRSSYKVLLTSKSYSLSLDDEDDMGPKVLQEDLQSTQGDNEELNEQTLLRSEEQLLAYVHNGDIEQAGAFTRKYAGFSSFPPIDSTELLMKYATTADQLPNATNSLLILIDFLSADVNATDISGRTPLHHLILNPEVGTLLIMRGANILLCDDSGMCPLSLSFNHHQDWLLQEFEACGREAHLLQYGSNDELFRFVTYLILAGYSTKAQKVIQLGRVTITADDATALMSSCTGNFENMKEPVETFELLESLGARLDDI